MDELEMRVEEAVDRLDLTAQVRLLTGSGFWRTWAEPRIGLRAMVFSDGPAGVRGEQTDERATSANLPCPTALAASWDERLVGELGGLLAAEARRHGVDVLLAPTVNIQRSPLAGRHFECYSEDPLLSGRIGAALVIGLQAGGVAATVKHYVANDAETDRFTVDVRLDERTLHEVYLAPFEHIVANARPWAVMAAYNGVEGSTMTEHPLLVDPLVTRWGFDGVVVSDWFATRDTVGAGRAGLHLTMPGPAGPAGPWGDALLAAVERGEVPADAVADKARRLLRLAARVGALDGPAAAGSSGSVPVSAPRPTETATARLLRRAAAAGIVLTRNARPDTGAPELPWDAAALRRVAVIGPNGLVARSQGGGSATVYPADVVGPVAGLRAALGQDVEVQHAVGARPVDGLRPLDLSTVTDPESGLAGLRVRYLDANGAVLRSEHRTQAKLTWLSDPLLLQAAAIEVSGRLRPAAGGEYRIGVAGLGRYRLVLDGKPVLDERIEADGDIMVAFLRPPERAATLRLDAGRDVDLSLRHDLDGMPVAAFTLGVEPPEPSAAEQLTTAVDLAAASDVAVVVVGTTERIESEGFDRTSLDLPGDQDGLVRRVAAANPRTVVVVNAGAPVTMPWRDDVAAVLLGWFGGEQFGHALADVLLGVVEPGGRLPTTWPATQADCPVLSTTPDAAGRLTYTEGLHVGYRAWARPGVAAPAYPFGHGLGYTTWAYREVVTTPGESMSVRVRVRNSGARRGRTVVQAYLSRRDSAVERPALWLAGFAGVEADPGEDVVVDVDLAGRAFSHWEPGVGWAAEPGAFELRVGPSSADLPLSAWIRV